MTPLVSSVNSLLSVLTVFAQIASVVVLMEIVIKKTKGSESSLSRFVSKNYLLLMFIVALVATLGSLFYSEVAGFEPCKLCWFQRILMYPQVLLLGMALWKKDPSVVKYSIALSSIGAVIAIYHYLLQRGMAPGLPCAAVGYSVNCSKVFVMNFGYITIPLMAFSAFALILTLGILNRVQSKPPATNLLNEK
ncbi:MAG: disulfide oxidoreductase [Patescibacteria group bacterium]